MEKKTGTVGDTVARQVTVKKGTPEEENTLVYDVTLEPGGKFSTFKKEIADEAVKLKGSQATVTFRSVQKGNFTNQYLDAIVPYQEALNEALDNSTGISEIPVVQNGTGKANTIDRQSALKTAFNYAGQAGLSQEEAFELAEQIYNAITGKSVESGVPQW